MKKLVAGAIVLTIIATAIPGLMSKGFVGNQNSDSIVSQIEPGEYWGPSERSWY